MALSMDAMPVLGGPSTDTLRWYHFWKELGTFSYSGHTILCSHLFFSQFFFHGWFLGLSSGFVFEADCRSAH